MLPKRNAYITKFFIVAWLIVYVLDITIFTKATGLFDWLQNILRDSHGRLNDLLALVPNRLAYHEYWRLISYAFIHFGIAHVVGNILLFTFVGNILETKISAFDFITPILLGNIVAGIGLVAIFSPDAYHSGSSPGIYALFGVLASNLYFRKIRSSKYMSVSEKNRIIAILLLVNFLGVDTLVNHVIGFAVGLICGFIQVKCNHTFAEK